MVSGAGPADPGDAAPTVRLARPDEAAACRAIEIEGAAMFAPFLPPGAPLAEPYSVETFATAARENRLLVVDGAETGLLGFALLTPDGDAVHVSELDIRRARQGRGLGARLLDGVEAWGAARGFTRITLTTFRAVPFNRAYYERRGFRPIAVVAGGAALQAEAAFQASLGYGPETRLAMARPIAPVSPSGERQSPFDSAGGLA